MALDKRTMQLISQKVHAGQGLSQATPEKQAAYDAYKRQVEQQVINKAKSGQTLSNASGWKTNLYNQTKQQQPNMNNSIEDMFGQSQTYLNNMFNQQKESQLAALRSQRDQAVGNVNAQKAKVAPQYQNMRNQTDVTNHQNVQKLREIMAANGLNATGENVSANVAMNNERVNSLSKLNLQEQETINDYDRQISDLMNPAQEQQLIASIEAQRAQALYEARNRAEDVGYSRYRDGVADTRYADELAYGRGRDTIADQRYDKEWNYNVGRDKVADQRYNKEWDYNVGRDKVADGRYTNEWNYQVGRDKIGDQRYLDEQAYERRMQEQQLALSRQREARISSGGGSSSGGSSGSKDSKGNPVAKPKTQANSYNDAITYWTGIKGDIKKHGAYRVEKGILNDPKALEEIRGQGYDIGSYIDALYYVASDGKFKKKADYDEYVKSLSEW